MQIAIDVKSTGGSITGKGVYTLNLVKELVRIDPKKYVLIGDQNTPDFGPVKLIRFKSGPFWHLKVLSFLKKNKFKYYFSPTSFIVPSLLKHKTTKPIITVHDLAAFIFPNQNNKKALIVEKITLKKACKKSKYIFCVSENTKKDLVKILDIDPSKIIKAPPAANKDFFEKPSQNQLSKVRDKYKLPNEFLLSVSTIEPRKNQKLILEAFEELKDDYPNLDLVLIGGKGWGDHSFLNKKSSRVHLTGYVPFEELKYFYNLSKAFLFPSIYEGFGIPALEAIATGTPVISSNNSSLPEVCGNAAIYIDPYSKEDLTGAIKKIISDAKLRQSLLNKASKQSRVFSWEKTAKILHETLTK